MLFLPCPPCIPRVFFEPCFRDTVHHPTPRAGLGVWVGSVGLDAGTRAASSLSPGALQECTNCCWNKSRFCVVGRRAVLIVPRLRANAPSGLCRALRTHSCCVCRGLDFIFSPAVLLKRCIRGVPRARLEKNISSSSSFQIQRAIRSNLPGIILTAISGGFLKKKIPPHSPAIYCCHVYPPPW